jgi:hypothetical protein
VEATHPVDDTTTAFADIVYADPELLRVEFEQVVSLLLVGTCEAASPHVAAGPGRPLRRLGAQATNSWVQELPERVRAPPRPAAGVPLP